MKNPLFVCVECQEKMVAVKNGLITGELDSEGKIFRVWAADLFECPNCGYKILARFARQPVHEETDPGNYHPVWKSFVTYSFY